jgi:hypothetical protein
MAATTPYEIALPFTSRFKSTRLYIGASGSLQGRAFWGIWQPLNIELDGDERQVTVQQGLDGCLDFIAGKVYKDRTLWPVIAQVNLIDKPFEDVVVGMRLIIPKLAKVRAALAQASKTTVQAAQLSATPGSAANS